MCQSKAAGGKRCNWVSTFALYIACGELAAGATSDPEDAYLLFSQPELLTKSLYTMIHQLKDTPSEPDDHFKKITNTSRILIRVVKRHDELHGISITQLLAQEDARERVIKYLVRRGDMRKSELSKLPTDWLIQLI